MMATEFSSDGLPLEAKTEKRNTMSLKNHIENTEDPSFFVKEKDPILDNSYGSMNSTNEVPTPTVSVPKKKTFFQIIRTLTIEPFLFMTMFAYFSRSICVTNLAIDKACRNYYGYNDTICGNLSNNTSIKNQVEKMANDYSLYMNLIQMTPGAVVMIFLGPWSDLYGRKPPLFIALCGFLLEDIGIILNTYYFDLSINYLLLNSVFSGSVGGYICLITLIHSIASDVTTKEVRTLKYALLEMSFGLGTALGTLAGGVLYKSEYSYYASFGVSTAMHALSIPWLVFMVAETRTDHKNTPLCTKMRRMFSSQNVVEGWKACIKPRENKGRCQIWILMASMCGIVLTYECFSSIAYLYVFHIYNWDPEQYSKVHTTFIVIGLAGLLFFVPLLIKVLKVNDGTLGFMGSMSLLSQDFAYGFSENRKWLYYIGCSLGIFGGFATFSVRSRLSKIVDSEELGKVFAFLSTCESLVPQIGSIVITRVYNATLDFFPGAAYILGGIILILPVGAFLWISRLKPMEQQKSALEKET